MAYYPQQPYNLWRNCSDRSTMAYSWHRYNLQAYCSNRFAIAYNCHTSWPIEITIKNHSFHFISFDALRNVSVKGIIAWVHAKLILLLFLFLCRALVLIFCTFWGYLFCFWDCVVWFVGERVQTLPSLFFAKIRVYVFSKHVSLSLRFRLCALIMFLFFFLQVFPVSFFLKFLLSARNVYPPNTTHFWATHDVSWIF